MTCTLRPYRGSDRDAVYDVCVRTGDAGGDARGLFRDDDLLPDVYAGPYLHLEPELAFVLDDGERVVGYVLGTADTAAFVRAYRERWLPLVGAQHPLPGDGDGDGGREAAVRRRLHEPEQMLLPELAAHPAHLHVDLLPSVQGRGLGRALLETFLAAVAAAGAPAVHLGVAAENTRALGFYARLGFTPLPVPGGTYLGRATGGGPAR